MWIVFKLFFLIFYWGYTSFFLFLVLQSWLYIWLDGWLLPHSNFPILWQCLWHIQIILVSDKACCISKFKIFWYIACLILVGSNSISIIGSFNRNQKKIRQTFSYSNCQAQPQFQLGWAEIALISTFPHTDSHRLT